MRHVGFLDQTHCFFSVKLFNRGYEKLNSTMHIIQQCHLLSESILPFNRGQITMVMSSTQGLMSVAFPVQGALHKESIACDCVRWVLVRVEGHGQILKSKRRL